MCSSRHCSLSLTPTHLVVPSTGPPTGANNIEKFCFLLHLFPSPKPSGWGLLKGQVTLVQGIKMPYKAVMSLSLMQSFLSVFFLLHIFPSDLEVYIPPDLCQWLHKSDVGETPAPEPNWQRIRSASFFPHLSTTLPTQSFFTPKFSKSYSVYSLPSSSFLWLP